MPSLRLSPLTSLALAALCAAAILALQLWHLFAEPWLGVTLKAQGEQVVVARVATSGPNVREITPGTRLDEVRLEGVWLALRPELLLEEPDVLPTLEGFRAFMRDQGRLHRQLLAGTLALRDAAAQAYTLHTGSRPWAQVPGIFWAQQLFGIAGLLIGVGVWAFNPRSTTTRLLLLNGIGFYLACISAAHYSSRELALDAGLFLWLSNLNHAGVMLFAVGFMGLLWHYPRALGRFPLERVTLPLFLLFFLANITYLTGAPSTGRYSAVLLAFVTGIAFSVVQWRRSRGRPVERAALKWFLFSIYLGCGIFVLAATLPILFGTAPIAEQSLLLGTFLLMYVGMVLGVVRYRLFDLDRWWLQVWVWFFGGVALVATDLLLLTMAGLGETASLTLALLLVGWLYFPLRQWLLGRFSSELQLDRIYRDPAFIDQMLRMTKREALSDYWEQQLAAHLRPLQLSREPGELETVAIEGDGEGLRVPRLEGEQHLLLRHRSQGGRLFTRADQQGVDALLSLFRFAATRIEAREAGAELERRRLSRDLHDDLGARLLALIHNAADDAAEARAREAMVVLREALDNLEGRPMPILLLVGKLRREIGERLEAAEVVLEWHDAGIESGPVLSARSATNLMRVARELVTNALKHAAPEVLSVRLWLDPEGLHLRVTQQGRASAPEGWHEGRGWAGLRTRCAELGGRIERGVDANQATYVGLDLPLEGNSGEAPEG